MKTFKTEIDFEIEDTMNIRNNVVLDFFTPATRALCFMEIEESKILSSEMENDTALFNEVRSSSEMSYLELLISKR